MTGRRLRRDERLRPGYVVGVGVGFEVAGAANQGPDVERQDRGDQREEGITAEDPEDDCGEVHEVPFR